ncbi:GTP binding protein [Xylariales sp. AK1849]|nr:GTP binding protein [Xylariales sp. AK1849]
MAGSSADAAVLDGPGTVSHPLADETLMTPNEVEVLFRSSKEQATSRVSSEDEDGEAVLTHDECPWRTERLGQVLFTVRKLLDSGSDQLDAIAQKIGDGSRDASWRLPLGQSGVLDFFISLVGDDGLQQAITTQSLRIIGNSCADTDENRARVVAADCLPKIVNLLNNDSVLAFVIPVLFNICVDYGTYSLQEPAQVAAYKAGINPELVTLISGPRAANAEAFMNIICKLLALVANQEPEANFVHPATPFVLLKLATSSTTPSDFEDFLGQTSVALTYLSNQAFQDPFLQTPNAIPLFLRAFAHCCTDLDVDTTDPDDAAQLKKIQSIFTQALADTSANPLFASSCPIGGPVTQTLQRWIDAPNPQLRSAACLALGNIARSDEACISLVQTSLIHRPLVAILSNPSNTDAQLLHSALSFLKNLAIPASNKKTLSSSALWEPQALPRIWGLDTQVQVQFTAVSLARLLLVSSPDNVKRICALSSSVDPSSQGHDNSHLHTLLGLFLRSDQEPTKTEAARAVAAVLRVLHSSSVVLSVLPTPLPAASPTSSSTTALQTFHTSHEAIPKALIYLGTQTKFPVLRSDLWFVMALMSRSPPGADVVANCLKQTALLRALVEAVVGNDAIVSFELAQAADADEDATTTQAPEPTIAPPASLEGGGIVSQGLEEEGLSGLGLEPQQVDPAKKAGMARIDRENGLVLIAELLQRCPQKLPVLPLERYREILTTGGEMVLSDRGGPGVVGRG